MIIIPALVYLRYSAHTTAILQKWGWIDTVDVLDEEQDEIEPPSYH